MLTPRRSQAEIDAYLALKASVERQNRRAKIATAIVLAVMTVALGWAVQ